jgi:hypothetical protein
MQRQVVDMNGNTPGEAPPVEGEEKAGNP